MEKKTKYYVVREKAVPEVLLKVVEAKRILDSERATTVQEATDAELAEIAPYIDAFCGYFGEDREQLLHSRFFVLTPNSKNPYKQLYTYN